VANRDDLDETAALIGWGCADLPRAPGFEDVRVDDDSSNGAGFRPVVAQALPDEADGPGIAFGDFCPRVSLVVDLEVLGVDIRSQVRPPLGEVPCRFEDAFGPSGGLFDDMYPRHRHDPTMVGGLSATNRRGPMSHENERVGRTDPSSEGYPAGAGLQMIAG
jgi:hypothetical protein